MRRFLLATVRAFAGAPADEPVPAEDESPSSSENRIMADNQPSNSAPGEPTPAAAATNPAEHSSPHPSTPTRRPASRLPLEMRRIGASPVPTQAAPAGYNLRPRRRPALSTHTDSVMMSRPDFVHKGDVDNASISTLRSICNRFGVNDIGNKEALRARILAKMAEKTVDDFSARPNDDVPPSAHVPDPDCDRNDPNVITTSTTKKNLASINDPIVRGAGDIHGKSDRPEADFNQLPLPAAPFPSSQPARSWLTDRSVMERTVGQRAPPTPPLALPTAAVPPRPVPASPRASPGVSMDVSAPLSSGAILQDWLSTNRQLSPAEYDACVLALRGSVKDGVSQRRPPMRVPVAAGSFGISMVPSATGRRVPVRPSASAQLPPQAVANAFRTQIPLTPGVRSSTGIPSNRHANAAEVMQPQPRNEASRTEVVPVNHQAQSSMPNDTTSERKGASDGNNRHRQRRTAQTLPVSMPPSHVKRETEASALPQPALPNRFAGAAGGPGDNNVDRPAPPDQSAKREMSGKEWMDKFLSERFKGMPMKEDAKYGDMVPPQQTLQHFNEYRRPKGAPLPPATVVAINEKRVLAGKKYFKFPPLPRDILKRMKVEREKRALEQKWQEKLRALDIEQRKKVRLAMWQNKPVESILGGELVDFRHSVKKEPTLYERMRVQLAQRPKSPPLSIKARRALAFLKAIRDDTRNDNRDRIRKAEFPPALPPSMKRQRISGGFFVTTTPLGGSSDGNQNPAAMQDVEYERPLDEVVRARMYKKKRLEQEQKELEKKAFETEDLRTKCKINFGAKPDTLKESQAPSKEQEQTSTVGPTISTEGPTDEISASADMRPTPASSDPQALSLKQVTSAKLSEKKPANSTSLFGQSLPSAQGPKSEQPLFTVGFNKNAAAKQSLVAPTTPEKTAIPQLPKTTDNAVESKRGKSVKKTAIPFDPFGPPSSAALKLPGSSAQPKELPSTAPGKPLTNPSFGFKLDNESGHAKDGQFWTRPLHEPSQVMKATMNEKDEEKTEVRNLFGEGMEESKMELKYDPEAKKSEVAKKSETPSTQTGDQQAKLSFTSRDSKANETMNTSDNVKRRVDTHNPNGKHPFTSFPLSSAPASSNPPFRTTLPYGLDSGKMVMEGTGTTDKGLRPLDPTGTAQNNQEGGKEIGTGTGTVRMGTGMITGIGTGTVGMGTGMITGIGAGMGIETETGTGTGMITGIGTGMRTGLGTDLQPGMAITPSTDKSAHPTRTTGAVQEDLRDAGKDPRTLTGTDLQPGLDIRRGTATAGNPLVQTGEAWKTAGTDRQQGMGMKHGAATAVNPQMQTGEAWRVPGTDPSSGTGQSHQTRTEKSSKPESEPGIRTRTVIGTEAQIEIKPQTEDVPNLRKERDVNFVAGSKPQVDSHIRPTTETPITETVPTSTTLQGTNKTPHTGEGKKDGGSHFGTFEQQNAAGPQPKGQEGSQATPSGFHQISTSKALGSVFGSAAQSVPKIQQSNKPDLVFGVKHNEPKEEENATVKAKDDASKPVFGNGQSQKPSATAATLPVVQSTPFTLGSGNSSTQGAKLPFSSKNPFGLAQSGNNEESGEDAMATTDASVVKDSKPAFTESQPAQATPFGGFQPSQPTPFGSVAQKTSSAPFAFGRSDGVAEKQPGPFGGMKFNRSFQLGSASSFVFGAEKPPPTLTTKAEALGGAPGPSTTGGPSALKQDLPQPNPFAKPPSTVSPFATAPTGFGTAGQSQGFSIPGSSGAPGTSSASGSQNAFPTSSFGTAGASGFGQGANTPFSFGTSGAGNSGPVFGAPGGLSASNPFGNQGTNSSVFGATPFNAPEPKPFGVAPTDPFASGNPFGGSGAQAASGTGGNETTGSGQAGAFGAPSGQAASGPGAGAFAMGSTAPRRKLKAKRMLR